MKTLRAIGLTIAVILIIFSLGVIGYTVIARGVDSLSQNAGILREWFVVLACGGVLLYVSLTLGQGEDSEQ